MSARKDSKSKLKCDLAPKRKSSSEKQPGHTQIHAKTSSLYRQLKLKIVYKRTDDLRPRAVNPRVHSPKQRRALKASIEKFGFVGVIIASSDGEIICGHERWAAAKDHGIERVPVIVIDHLTPVEIRQFVIADNRIGDLSSFDRKILVAELTAIIEIDADFEPLTAGYEVPEIEFLVEQEAEKPSVAADELPTMDLDQPAVTGAGDVWILGKHRLLCANARDSNSYRLLLNDEVARMVLTDPPYGVKIQGHVSGNGRIKHREFPEGSGITSKELQVLLRESLTLAAEHSTDGALAYVFMDFAHLRDLLNVGAEIFTSLKNIITWVKPNGGMGSLYRSQSEFIAVFKKGTASHRNNVLLGKYGRNRTNVWRYAGGAGFAVGRLEDLQTHPTLKPVAMLADAMRDVSKRNDIILDPYCGAGSTIIAAELCGRRVRGIELDPLYCDVAVRRWQKMVAEPATLEATGETFDEVAARRLKGASHAA